MARAPNDSSDLPLVLAGPLLRRLEERRLVLWLATSQVSRLRLELTAGNAWSAIHELEPGTPACRHLVAGTRLHYLLVDIRLAASLPVGRWIGYRLALAPLICGGYPAATVIEAPQWVKDWAKNYDPTQFGYKWDAAAGAWVKKASIWGDIDWKWVGIGLLGVYVIMQLIMPGSAPSLSSLPAMIEGKPKRRRRSRSRGRRRSYSYARRRPRRRATRRRRRRY